MDSVLKIIIGIIIGAVGFWVLQPKPEAVNASPGDGAESKAQQEAVKLESQAETKIADGDAVNTGKKVDYKGLEKDQYLSPSDNPKGIVLGKKGRSQPDTTPPKPLETNTQSQDSKSENKYLEGIPEDYHKLLNPPERRKDLPELHRDLVEEEQDLNWGLGMEQQIKSFVMNHPHSNYLLDFRVTCKTTMCEMMSKVPAEHTKKWSDLCNEMIREGWWEFTGMSASGNYSEDKKNYINIRHMTRTKKD